MTLGSGWQWIGEKWREGRGRGLVLSLLLHGLGAYLVLMALPGLFQQADERDSAIPVELVSAPADPGAAGGAPEAAPGEPAKGDKGASEPVASPAPAVARHAATPTPAEIGAKPHAPSAKPTGQPQARRVVRPHESREQSAAAGAGSAGGAGSGGPFDIRDFLRAQIERRWEFDVGQLGQSDFVVGLHLRLDPDGAIRTADIVGDPRYQTSPSFKAAADSARRAALVASPFQIPAGKYGVVDDVTVELSPRDALQ